MAHLIETYNKIQMGSAWQWGKMDRAGFAVVEIMRQKFANYPDVAKSSVTFNEALGGVTLTPIQQSENMALSAWSVNSGTWAESTIPGKLTYLQQTNGTASTATSITSVARLSSSPSFSVDINRDNAPQATQYHDFVFGGGYTLRISRADYPTLTASGGVNQWLYPIGEMKSYSEAEEYRINVMSVAGELQITSSLWNGTWRIPGLGNLTNATLTISCNGGCYAFNASAWTYPASGFFATDWIEHGETYPDEDVTFTYGGHRPVGTDYTAEIDDTDGSRKGYKITLEGDGARTPILYWWQADYEPAFSYPSNTYTDITDYYLSGSVSMSSEAPARSANIVFDNEGGAHFSSIAGTRSIQISLGRKFDDASTEQAVVLTGLLSKAIQHRTDADETWNIEVVDRWIQFVKTELWNMPLLSGKRVDLAVKLIAERAGIGTDYINVTESAFYLTETGNTDEPEWLIKNGVKAADLLNKIAEEYGVIIEFDKDGYLLCRDKAYGASVQTFVEEPTTDSNYLFIESLDFERDYLLLDNYFVQQGRDYYGNSITSIIYDNASINTENGEGFIGFRSHNSSFDDNLTNQAAVNLANVKRFDHRERALPRAPFFVPFGAVKTGGAYLRPNEVFSITESNTGAGGKSYRLVQHTIEFDVTQNRSSVVGEVLP